MRMVVLDGHTLNPGDISWEGLEKLGDLKVYQRTAEKDIVDLAKNAEILFTNKVPLSEATISQLHALKYIGVLATGYNIVDTAAAGKLGIKVANVPGYGAPSVVQLTFALLLELTHHVQRHSDSVFQGRWSSAADFSYWDFPLIELSGKTIGIIGFGSIGQQVADVAAAFGMKVLGYSRNQTDQSARKYFQWVSLDELLSGSDVVSLHCPLTSETRGIINSVSLNKMKKTAFLLNSSRGPLVEEAALAAALATGVIAGAGIDVLSTEPPHPDNPLLSAKNCLITPHIAWASKEARTRLMAITVSNLEAFLEGRPVNLVN